MGLRSDEEGRALMMCKHFGRCGGCVYQDIPYKEELDRKMVYIEELFGKEVEKIVPSPKIYFYRNKVDLTIDRGKVGFRERGKWWRVIDLEECLIFSEKMPRYLEIIRDHIDLKNLSYDIRKKRGFLRYVVIREGKFVDNKMVIFVTTSKIKFDFSVFLDYFDSVIWEINDSLSDVSYGEVKEVLGKEFWEEKFFKYNFFFLPNAFAQTNSYAAQELYKLVYEMTDSGKTLLDAYAGVGTFGMLLSEKFEEVIGVESWGASVKSFEINKEKLGIENYKMIKGKVEEVIKKIDFDVLLLDPPRAGLHPKVIKVINEKRPKEIIYVSCNPKTQIEDIKRMRGYEMEIIQPVDMFPRTDHVENIVKLVRESS